MNKKASVSV